MKYYDKSERIEQIVNKISGGDYRQYGNELRCRCPRSNNPEYHPKGDETPSFFVNLNTGHFHCFSCPLKGGYKSLLKLVGADYYPEIEEVENIINKYKSKSKSEKEIKEVIDLPPNLIPSWIKIGKKISTVSEYLKGRNVPGWILKELDIHISKSYGLLSNAIIYPIKYKNYSFWGARIVDPKCSAVNPYFYPKFSPKERVLYNIENWKEEYESVILVEGWFDFIRLRLYGFENVIPLFGKTMSIDYQVNNLIDFNIRKVYIMLDKDALSDAIELGGKIVRFFDVFIPRLEAKDPDLATEDEIDKALFDAENYYDLI